MPPEALWQEEGKPACLHNFQRPLDNIVMPTFHFSLGELPPVQMPLVQRPVAIFHGTLDEVPPPTPPNLPPPLFPSPFGFSSFFLPCPLHLSFP